MKFKRKIMSQIAMLSVMSACVVTSMAASSTNPGYPPACPSLVAGFSVGSAVSNGVYLNSKGYWTGGDIVTPTSTPAAAIEFANKTIQTSSVSGNAVKIPVTIPTKDGSYFYSCDSSGILGTPNYTNLQDGVIVTTFSITYPPAVWKYMAIKDYSVKQKN